MKIDRSSKIVLKFKAKEENKMKKIKLLKYQT